MAKKRGKKHTASGIDLSGLSFEQLNALISEARENVIKIAEAKSREQAEKENKSIVKELKDSGEFAVLKEEFAALKEECEKLDDDFTFDVVVPIRFTMYSGSPIICDEGFDPVNCNSLELFDWQFTAELSMCHELAKMLNKKQVHVLNRIVKRYAEDACDEIFDIVPEEIINQHHDFGKRVTEFFQRIKAFGLTFNDII